MIMSVSVYVQYYSDANAAESWMKEKEPLVVSEDYGHDEASAKVRIQLRTIIVYFGLLRIVVLCI